MGAGVQGYEALEAAQKVGLTVTTGECPTVGIAGGYTQGGGHSLSESFPTAAVPAAIADPRSSLASKYGLAADQTLEFEVITATSGARLLKASPTENSDLYWALSGGGGGS